MPEAALSVPVDDKQYVMIVAGVPGVDPFGSTEGAFKGVHKSCGCFRG